MDKEELYQLLEECRDFIANCVGSSYHDTSKEDEEFLKKLDKTLATNFWWT